MLETSSSKMIYERKKKKERKNSFSFDNQNPSTATKHMQRWSMQTHSIKKILKEYFEFKPIRHCVPLLLNSQRLTECLSLAGELEKEEWIKGLWERWGVTGGNGFNKAVTVQKECPLSMDHWNGNNRVGRSHTVTHTCKHRHVMFYLQGYSFHQLCTKEGPVLMLLRRSYTLLCTGIWVQKQGQVQQWPNIKCYVF